MHAGKCNVCSKEVGTQRGRKNNELTHVVKPHLLSGVNVASFDLIGLNQIQYYLYCQLYNDISGDNENKSSFS